MMSALLSGLRNILRLFSSAGARAGLFFLFVSGQLSGEPFLVGDVVYYKSKKNPDETRIGSYLSKLIDGDPWIIDQTTGQLERASAVTAFPIRAGDFVRFPKPDSRFKALGYVKTIEPSGSLVIHSFLGPPLTLPREQASVVDIKEQVFFCTSGFSFYRVSENQVASQELTLETWSPVQPMNSETPHLPEHLIQCEWIFPEHGFQGLRDDFTDSVSFPSGRQSRLITVNVSSISGEHKAIFGEPGSHWIALHWQPILPKGYVLFNPGFGIILPDISWSGDGISAEPARVISREEWSSTNPGYVSREGRVFLPYDRSSGLAVVLFLDGGRVAVRNNRVFSSRDLVPLDQSCAPVIAPQP